MLLTCKQAMMQRPAMQASRLLAWPPTNGMQFRIAQQQRSAPAALPSRSWASSSMQAVPCAHASRRIMRALVRSNCSSSSAAGPVEAAQQAEQEYCIVNFYHLVDLPHPEEVRAGGASGWAIAGAHWRKQPHACAPPASCGRGC